ncbi:carbohydrate esterase family 4 protein, putative [Rhizoctonia solani AG-3 Rhs1AP]|uniref:Carbohydrate esterase family 4 protein, putative n=1 Tax=Rhizoctonia solani AG-3 Rhs1AP TaxID=1086054 RepID=X8JJR7_9AGAM|nr:carbohydrate esterase family 4 protein, putative [Rhizoctonia solani AG-3 Rhs1AP]
MQFLAKLALAGAVASSFLGALAVPLQSSKVPRQLAQVITQCTVPNTVALTLDDGPYASRSLSTETTLAASTTRTTSSASSTSTTRAISWRLTLGATKTWQPFPGTKSTMRCGALKKLSRGLLVSFLLSCALPLAVTMIMFLRLLPCASRKLPSGTLIVATLLVLLLPNLSRSTLTLPTNARQPSLHSITRPTSELHTKSFPTLSLCSRLRGTGSSLLPSASASSHTSLSALLPRYVLSVLFSAP